jgi:cysteine-rich repeat protein
VVEGGGGSGEGGAGGAATVCGDVEVVAPELCDDGNVVDSDGCNADCTPSGVVLWSTTVDVGAQDTATGIAQLEDGRFVVSASSADLELNASQDIAYAIVDATGQLDERHRIDGSGFAETGTETDGGEDVVAIEGGFVLVGYEYVDNLELVTMPAECPWITAFDLEGGTLWTETAPNVPRGRGMAVTASDGTLYVGGHQSTPAWLRAYTFRGNPKWSLGPDLEPGGCNGCDRVTALAPIAGGVVVGAILAGDGADAWLAVIDENATERWSTVWNYGADERVLDVAADADDNVYAFGDVANGTLQFVRKYAPDGELLWQLDEPCGADLACIAWTFSPEGGFAATAVDGMGDARVVRCDEEGELRWEATLPEIAGVSLAAIRITADNQVAIAGRAHDAVAGTSDLVVALVSP